jgi:hypothetical protein
VAHMHVRNDRGIGIPGRLVAMLVLAAAPAAAIGAARKPPNDLSVYVNRLAFEPVRGYRFLGHPAVRRAVFAAAPTSPVARRILQRTMLTTVPIRAFGNWLLYSGCEQHVCPHQWSVLIDRRGTRAYVCYADHNQPGRWYLRRKLVADRQEGCAMEFSRIPAAISRALGTRP